MSYGNATTSAGTTAYAPGSNAIEQKESKALLDRMHAIRGLLGDVRGSATSIADMIVGHEPAQINSKGEATAQAPEPYAFLAQVCVVISEMERLVQDTGNQLNRLHRSF